MLFSTITWGTVAGIGHFLVIGLLYGNPFVDKQYTEAMQKSPAVKKWPSKPKYMLTQFLGTQIEVFILTFAVLWLRPLISTPGFGGAIALGLMLAAVRVYPRFWNMWIQSTYPNHLLAIEAINGTIGTLVIVAILEKFAL